MLRRIEIVQNIILTTILILYLVYLLALFLSATFVSQERFWAGLYGLIAGQLFWWLMIICAVVNLAIYFYLRDYKDFLIETGGYWEGERIIKSSIRIERIHPDYPNSSIKRLSLDTISDEGVISSHIVPLGRAGLLSGLLSRRKADSS